MMRVNPSIPWRGYIVLLRNPNFLLLWGAGAINLLGYTVFMLTLLWKAAELTGSPLILSSLFLTLQIPWLTLQPLTGSLADRLNRKRILFFSTLLRAVGLGLLAYSLLVDLFALWQLYAVALLLGTTSAFFQPAHFALLPRLVHAEELPKANSLLSGTREGIEILGPLLAGFLIVVLEVGGVLAFTAICYLLGTLLIGFLRPPVPSTAAHRQGPFGKDFFAGLRYVKGHRLILILLVFTGWVNFVTAPIGVFLPLFVEEILNSGPEGFGLLLSGMATGLLIGSLLAGWLPNRQHGLFLALSVVFAGLFWLGAFTASTHWIVVIVLFGLGGVGNGVFSVLATALLQRETAEEYRGRVASVTYLMAGGLMPLAYASMGVVAEWLGFYLVLIISCLLCAGSGLLGLLSTELRRLS